MERSVFRESTLSTRCRRGPLAPVPQDLAISWKALLATGVTKPVGFRLQPESSVDRFPSAEVKPSARGSVADPRGDF